MQIPTALATEHIRCRTQADDGENDRILYQVSTQADLIDDDALDEDEDYLDDNDLLFTTQTWSEGTFRRVFTSVYTSADDDRLYVDEDINGLNIGNPQFKYAMSSDRKTLRVAVEGLIIDDTTYETGPVTVKAVIRCP